MTRKLPPSASVAAPSAGEKLIAPAAARNAAALTELLMGAAPNKGRALEIASGTGQHIAQFAAALPGLHWQPSDVDPARLASINAFAAEAALENIAPAATLDATKPDWSLHHPDQDLILLINLLHLIATPEAQTLIAEAARALAPQGTLILYGPFKRSGQLTSDGDQRFDADLRGADPLIGYKDDLDILRWLGDAGLARVKTQAMPANNLAFIARKPS